MTIINAAFRLRATQVVTNNSPAVLKQAYDIGYKAGYNSEHGAPAMSKEYMHLLKTLPNKELGSSIDLSKAFNKGYYYGNDKMTNELMAD